MPKLLIKKFAGLHLGKLIGIGLFVTSLFYYRSYENRPVFRLWSWPFFIVLNLSIALFLIVLVITFLSRKKTIQDEYFTSPAASYFDLATLFWGTAYFIGVMDDTANASRILGLNLFGSIMPVAVCLEWIALMMLLVAIILYTSSRLAKKWYNIILMFSTILGLLLLIEGGIRFKSVISPATQGFPTYTSALWQRYHVKYNEEGFRDTTHSLAKDSNTRRILIIGDSYAFGYGIEATEDRFGSQIGQILAAETDDPWEVINMSRGDTHTLDHIEFLKRGLEYKPDVVLLLYVFNDIDYLYSVTPRNLQYSYDLNTILFKNFYLFQELYLRFYHIKNSYMKRERDNFDPYADPLLLSRHLLDVAAFVKLAEQSGAIVRIVPFDTRVILEDTFNDRYRVFLNAAEESNIPVWSIANIFNSYQYSQLIVNDFDRHPNELANRIAAGEIAERLLEKMLD